MVVELDEDLLQHIEEEFLEHGRRAVEFLRSAYALLNMSPRTFSRQAELIGYCLREALKEIPESQSIESAGAWKTISRDVVSAKSRLLSIDPSLSEEREIALSELLSCVDKLESFHAQESIHQKRLIAVILDRTGARPIGTGIQPLKAYQKLLSRADRAVHTSLGEEAATKLWNDSVAMLRWLFLPPESRYEQLDELAAKSEPLQADLEALQKLLVAPNHLQYFLQKIASISWVSLLVEKTELLEPPRGQTGWPFFSAIQTLKGEYFSELSEILEGMRTKWGQDVQQAWYLARAALDLGASGEKVVVKVLKKHPTVSGILSIAFAAVNQTPDPSDEFVESVAAIALNKASLEARGGLPEMLVKRIVEGISEENFQARITLLCHKLKALYEADPTNFYYLGLGVSILDAPAYEKSQAFYFMTKGIADCLERAAVFGDSEILVSTLSPLPMELRSRLLTWFGGISGSLQAIDLVDLITNAIKTRPPSADDLRAIDRVKDECSVDSYVTQWKDALGPVPTVVELGKAMGNGTLPMEWRRAFSWSALLPDPVMTEWEAAVTVIAASSGRPTRESIEQALPEEELLSASRSPMEQTEMLALGPEIASKRIAAWRPSPEQWLVSARELGRVLESAVKESPRVWGQSPLKIATPLYHPTYIYHYVQGLAETDLEGLPCRELIDLSLLIHTNPWKSIPLGSDSFDYDRDWRAAEGAAISLLKTMATSGLGFGGRDDEVWALLVKAARSRDVSSYVGGDDTDHLRRAINRLPTRALQAVLGFIEYEKKVHGSPRQECLELLDEVLSYEAEDGLEYRAILVPSLAFLRYAAEEWAVQRYPVLFGEEAPTGLAQPTIDLALKWGRPDRDLLEKFRGGVESAVKARVDGARQKYLIGMLWGIPGYVPESVFGYISSVGQLSVAAQDLGRMLSQSSDLPGEYIDRGISFWRAAVEAEMKDLAGFGWFANVGQIDYAQWLDLMVKTSRLVRGNFERSEQVASRIGSEVPSVEAVQILNDMVRGLENSWDRMAVIEVAAGIVRQATILLSDTPEFRRLRTTLMERGAL